MHVDSTMEHGRVPESEWQLPTNQRYVRERKGMTMSVVR